VLRQLQAARDGTHQRLSDVLHFAIVGRDRRTPSGQAVIRRHRARLTQRVARHADVRAVSNIAAEVEAFLVSEIAGLQRKPAAVDVTVLRCELAPVQPSLRAIVERENAQEPGSSSRGFLRMWHTTQTNEADVPRCGKERPVRKDPGARIAGEQRSDVYDRDHGHLLVRPLVLVALSFTITTRNFAGAVWLAFSDRTCTSSGPS